MGERGRVWAEEGVGDERSWLGGLHVDDGKARVVLQPLDQPIGALYQLLVELPAL